MNPTHHLTKWPFSQTESRISGAKNGENFEWALLRGGNIVRKLGNEATLHIKSAEPTNDFGVYRCNVEDDNGVVIGSAYTAVTVGYGSPTNAQVVKFDEKSDATFTCPVYSVPGSKVVQWSKTDAEELPRNAIPNGNKLEYEYNYRIKDFDDSTSGMYMCRVTFDDNVVEGYVDAQIFGSLSFHKFVWGHHCACLQFPTQLFKFCSMSLRSRSMLEIALGSTVSVAFGGLSLYKHVKVTGDPSAVIMWSKEDTDELPENSQVIQVVREDYVPIPTVSCL
ncbi:unnamed protein product [Cylicostephanus goldi]|uniref:Ig-like domain-containing protein n=1 Tax=Cylicostephanus goldi TaxID=71465 RepID=A0A3P6S554_CYLGO|nr:unnamed protein product [Cylicostephanus goldi]